MMSKGTQSEWMNARGCKAHVVYPRCRRTLQLYFRLTNVSIFHSPSHQQRRTMANYHLLQSKAHDDEEEEEEKANLTLSHPGPEPIDLILERCYVFLTVLMLIATAFIVSCWFNSHLFSNGAALTNELSFLSKHSPRNDLLCEIPS